MSRAAAHRGPAHFDPSVLTGAKTGAVPRIRRALSSDAARRGSIRRALGSSSTATHDPVPEESAGLMARKLKTYQTSLGFFDLAIAAPSMKAALRAWGSETNLFHQGFAKETDDPAIVAATVAKPGVVLRRPVGSDGAFSEYAELPKELPIDKVKERTAKSRGTTREPTAQKVDDRWRSCDAGCARSPACSVRPRGWRPGTPPAGSPR
jgi:hypothetical protein